MAFGSEVLRFFPPLPETAVGATKYTKYTKQQGVKRCDFSAETALGADDLSRASPALAVQANDLVTGYAMKCLARSIFRDFCRR
jgi:hypothetical protein